MHYIYRSRVPIGSDPQCHWLDMDRIDHLPARICAVQLPLTTDYKKLASSPRPYCAGSYKVYSNLP